jgi:hypothetical protein
MIKAYGNVLTGKSATTFVSHKQHATEFDAYVADSRDEKVPDTYKSVVGAYTYNNFDTDNGLMYSYTPDAAEDVPAVVTGYYGAGRMNHGDFQWTFNNSVDDAKDAVDDALKSAVTNYATTLVDIFGEESSSMDGGSGEQGGGDNPSGGDEPVATGTVTCSFVKEGPVQSSVNFFTISGNYSNTKGTATVDGTTYTWCLKIESATTVDFKLTDKRNMTLYFGDTETASLKINGNKITGSGSIYSQVMEPGSYTLTKDKSVNLFYIKLEPVTESE